MFLKSVELFGFKSFADRTKIDFREGISAILGPNGCGKSNIVDGIKWVITRVVRPTETPFVGAYVLKDQRGPLNCSIYDHGDFCLYCVASSEWDKLAPHVSSGPQPQKS